MLLVVLGLNRNKHGLQDVVGRKTVDHDREFSWEVFTLNDKFFGRTRLDLDDGPIGQFEPKGVVLFQFDVHWRPLICSEQPQTPEQWALSATDPSPNLRDRHRSGHPLPWAEAWEL